MDKLGRFIAILKRGVTFDLLCLSLFSLFTCRALFSFDKSFVAGTDTLALHFPMEPYLWSNFRGWIYTWSPFGGCGFTIIPPTPPFLLTSFLALATSFVYDGFTTLVTKLPFFMLFPLAGFSMYFLTYRLLRNRVGAFISALFYMYNQWFLSEHISEGHMFIPFRYAMAPLIFLALENALRNPKTKQILILSTVLTFFLGSTSHPVYIFGSFSLLYLLFWIFLPASDRSKCAKTVVKVCFLAIIISLLLSAYWIIPEIGFGHSLSVLSKVFRPIDDAYIYSYKSPLDALSIRYSVDNLSFLRTPYWELPLLRQIFANGLILLVPILAFAAILIRRDRITIFYTLSAAISCFLALGPYGFPFQTFVWLWTHVPGYSTFRVGARFLMMTCLSYAYLIGVTVGWIYNKLSGFKWHPPNRFPKTIIQNLNKIFLTFIITIIISYSWVGSVEGFQVYNWPEEYMEPFEWVGSQPGDYRILTIPYGRVYCDYPWSSHGTDLGLSSYGIHNKGVFWEGSRPETFGNTIIQSNSTDMFSSFLGIANVRYIVFEPDAPSNEISFFNNQRNTVPTTFNGEATILENQAWSPHIFATQRSALIIGGRETFFSLSQVKGFDLSNWALLFSEQPDHVNMIDKTDALIFSDPEFTNLVFLLHKPETTIDAHSYSFPSEKSGEYWVKSEQWLNHGKLVLNRFTLTTRGNLSVDIPFVVSKNGTYHIMLRMMFAPDRGSLTTTVDRQAASTLNPYASTPTFKWVTIQTTSLTEGKHTLTLTNDGTGYNDIDEIVIVSPSTLQKSLEKTLNLLQDLEADIIYVLEAEDTFGNGESNNWRISRNWGSHASGGKTLVSNIPSEATRTLFIPRRGNYTIAMRVVNSPSYETPILKVDGSIELIFNTTDYTQDFAWYEANPVSLDQGTHTLTLINEGSTKVELDELIIFQQNDDEDTSLDNLFSTPQTETTQVKFTEKNPTEYRAQVKTETPFVLIFSESYHPLWRAYINGEETRPIVAYSFLNGFYINKTGEFDVDIKFTGQRYLEIGMVISAFTLLVVAAYFIHLRKKESGWQRLITRLLHRKRRPTRNRR